MKAVRGESGGVTLPTGERLTIDQAPINKIKDGALVHATPFTSIFDHNRGLVVKNTSEGGMFFAPSGSSRFASYTATGKTGPHKGYGILLDDEVIKDTVSSDKWWKRQGEIERVVPDDAVIPKVGQYLQAHSVPDMGGQPYNVVTLGGKLSALDIAKLKAQGILSAAQDLTPGGLRSKGWRIEDGPPVKPVDVSVKPVDVPGRPVDVSGRPVDASGRPVDASGRPVDADGRPVGPDGRPVDADGRPVGPDGRPVGPDGRPVGPDGRPVGPDGRPVGPDGRPVGPDGRRRGFDDGEVHGSGREIRTYGHLLDRTEAGSAEIAGRELVEPRTDLRVELPRVDPRVEVPRADSRVEVPEEPTQPFDRIVREPVQPEDRIVREPVQPEDRIVREPVQPEDRVVREPVQPEDRIVREPVQPEDRIVREPVQPEDRIVREPVQPEDTIGREPDQPEDRIIHEPPPPEDTIVREPDPPEDRIVHKPPPPEEEDIREPPPPEDDIIREPPPPEDDIIREPPPPDVKVGSGALTPRRKRPAPLGLSPGKSDTLSGSNTATTHRPGCLTPRS